MKLPPFLALSALLLLPAASVRADAKSDKVVQQLAGKWEAAFKGDAVTFEFGTDGTFTLGAKGDVMKGSFTVDASEEPWKMDLDAKGKNARQGYTIFRINADGTMDWVEPRDEEENRPTEFKKSFSFTKAGAAPAAGGVPGSIVGKWQAKREEKGDTVRMTFSADGKWTCDEGLGMSGTYKLDKSSTPHVLQITMDKKVRTFFMLCQIVDGKLKISDDAPTKEKLGSEFGKDAFEFMERVKEPGVGGALDPKLVGKWKGNADDEKILIEFKADGTFSLQKNEKDAISGTYSTQPETTPAQIDLTMGEKSGLAIYRIEGDRLTMTEPDNRRAKNFDAKDVLLAQKVK